VSKAAAKQALEELHASLATELAAAIKEKEIKIVEIPDESSETGTTKVVVRTRNAAVLSAARQFLKDNGIECSPGFPTAPVKSLVAGMPFTDAPDDHPTVN
jgi:peptidyl-tRNA hydrolase